jgi:uncharacterized integral membrane protein
MTEQPPPSQPPSQPPDQPPPDRVTPAEAPVLRDRDDPLRSSRTSTAWIAVVGSMVLIVLLVVFIVQNTTSVPLEFLWIDATVSLSVALLIATAVGMAIAALVGSLRIIQLRRRVKREKRGRR